MSELRRVGVVGAGLMGSGIAEVCARAGLDVLVTEADSDRLDAGRNAIQRSLDRGVRLGRLEQADAAAARDQLSYTTDMGDFVDRDIVIEAVAEVAELKSGVFKRLDEVVKDPDAVFATNTSSIPIAQLATATARPHRVIGLHFFNPVPAMNLVEVVPSLLTEDETRTAVERLVVERLGKKVVRSQDRAGFVVNALLVPYLISAIRMLESGFADAEDIDNGMRLGCGHPMGPLALCDMIGLDTVEAVADSLYTEFRDSAHAPPALLRRMVQVGRLGRKAGRGFFAHDGPR